MMMHLAAIDDVLSQQQCLTSNYFGFLLYRGCTVGHVRAPFRSVTFTSVWGAAAPCAYLLLFTFPVEVCAGRAGGAPHVCGGVENF